MRRIALLALLAGCLSTCGGRSLPRTVAPTTQVGPNRSSTGATATGTTAPSGPLTSLASGPAPCGWRLSPPATYRHVIWIIMENHSWPQVLGDSKAARYETALARQCGTATRYASVGSPSLPNYLGATSGSTHGIADDSPPSAHQLSADNLFHQVRSAGGTERSYQEGMTVSCQQFSSGAYAVKHNPAAYYIGDRDRAACQADNLPWAAFPADLQSNRLPTFALITPDLCHDTHDCGVGAGDAWLAGMLPPLLASPAYRSASTAVFLIWDEYTPMPNVVMAPSVRPGTMVSEPVNHYALLRATEVLLGLPTLAAAASAPDIRGPFHL